jgi:hypothetical protein
MGKDKTSAVGAVHSSPNGIWRLGPRVERNGMILGNRNVDDVPHELSWCLVENVPHLRRSSCLYPYPALPGWAEVWSRPYGPPGGLER